MHAPAIALLLALQAPAPELELRAGVLAARVSGSMKFDEKPAVGDRVDLRGDLGAGTAVIPSLSVRLTSGADRFSIGATRALVASEETLGRDRRWNESLLPAGEEVRARLDLFEGDIAYERRLAEGQGFDFWAGAAARYVRLEAVLRSPSQGRDDDHAISFAPAVRLAAGWEPAPRWRLEAEVEATAFGGGDLEVRGGAGALAVAWRPSPSVSLRLGWRSGGLRLTKDDSLERNELRIRADGPTLGLELRW